MPGRRYAWERALLAMADLQPTTKLVGLALATYANGDGTKAHPGQERLATDCGISSRSIRTHLTTLRERGWIECTFSGSSMGRRAFSDEYSLVVPTVDHRNETSADGVTEHRNEASADAWGFAVAWAEGTPEADARTPEPDDRNTGTGLPPTSTTNPETSSVLHHPAASAAEEQGKLDDFLAWLEGRLDDGALDLTEEAKASRLWRQGRNRVAVLSVIKAARQR